MGPRATPAPPVPAHEIAYQERERLREEDLFAVGRGREHFFRLSEIMRRAFDEILDLAERQQIDLRTAAYALALTRIGEAIEAGGTQSYFSAS